MIYDGEFSEFSILWLYTTKGQDSTMEEDREKFLDMLGNIRINNVIDKRLRKGLVPEDVPENETETES